VEGWIFAILMFLIIKKGNKVLLIWTFVSPDTSFLTSYDLWSSQFSLLAGV
jgi:hypothetical protein